MSAAVMNWVRVLVLPALLAAWLVLGEEGYGNLFKVILVIDAIASFVGLSEAALKKESKGSGFKGRFGTLRRVLYVGSLLALVWFGHFGWFALMAWVSLSIEYRVSRVQHYRTEANVNAGA